jgi:plasmid stabilization system protein ParE
MAHRLAPQAADDLDSIWFYVATERGSIEAANRLVDSLTQRFLLLAQHPYMGRVRDEDFGPGSRSFAVASTSYSIASASQTS